MLLKTYINLVMGRVDLTGWGSADSLNCCNYKLRNIGETYATPLVPPDVCMFFCIFIDCIGKKKT